MVCQVNGDYECNEASMSKCICIIKDDIEPLKSFLLEQLRTLENHQADGLSKFTSSGDCDIPRTTFWELKLTENWEGSYMVVEEVRSGTFSLQDLNGRPIQ